MRWLNHRFLDGPGTDEAVKDSHRAGLVVGARGASTAERLLADNSARALVVDVEHTAAVAQQVASGHDGVAIGGEDGSGESVLGGSIDDLAGLLEFFVRVDENGEDRTEDLVDHGDRLGVLGLNDGGADVETLGVITRASGEDLAAFLLGGADETHDLVVRVTSDHRTHEVREFLDGSDSDALDVSKQLLLEPALPHRCGHIKAGERRALLTLVFESAADGLNDGMVRVSRFVHKVEILAARLSDNAGVTAVLVEVVGNLFPQLTEDKGRTGEVQASELAVVDSRTDDRFGRAWQELNDSSGEAGLLENLGDDVVGVDCHGRWLPDDDVADHCGR